ncbi:hypothetical protein ACFVMC_21030 [Nocardia sp. NPDC127579]|uniref:hypothetical protein n=1 Tax=Nocardia sp. NPDC127579 TaxID=3345402 RepID=UPI00362B60B2
MKRSLVGASIVSLLTVGVAIGTAGNASASAGCGGGCEGSYYRKEGTGRYSFHVVDSKADGYAVEGYIRKKSNNELIEKVRAEGNGDSNTISRSLSAGYATFQPCTVKAGNTINCAAKVSVG